MESIAIHGLGVVGGALCTYLEEQGQTVYKIDPGKGLDDAGAAMAPLHFICVPTPFDAAAGGFLLDYVRAALARVPAGATAVIKSTVVPGSTATLQAERPDITLLFSPEFLTEKTAEEDLRHPDRQIVGYASEAGHYAADAVLPLLPRAPYEAVMPATEAELVKYFSNAFYANRVIFANMMYDLCAAMGADYEQMRAAASADTRIGPSHLDVWHGGYRGYGGKCLPKDVRALTQLADALGVDAGLLHEIERRNNALLSATQPPEL